jgi:hypothetical protein
MIEMLWPGFGAAGSKDAVAESTSIDAEFARQPDLNAPTAKRNLS